MPPTCRKLETILQFHKLPLSAFEGAEHVFDLGCGMSDLGADLAASGIEATVTGFDQNPNAFILYDRTSSSTRPVIANLNNLPVEDDSADVAIATYSLPIWGQDPQEIQGFFDEGQRVVKPGGLLSIVPIAAASRGRDFTATKGERLAAAQAGARQIHQSLGWTTLRYDSSGITARKLK